MGWMGGDGWGWGMGGFLMVLFWVVVIVVVVLAARWAGGSNAAPRSGTPLEILEGALCARRNRQKEFETKNATLRVEL